jgi:hypothetical protein
MRSIPFALGVASVLALSASAFADPGTPTTSATSLSIVTTAPSSVALDPALAKLRAPSGAAERPANPFRLQLAVATETAAAEQRTTIFGLPLNEGPGDRIIRGVIAASLIGVATWGLVSNQMDGWVSGVLYGVSAIPALTAITGYCPLYHLFGLKYSF